MAKKWIKGAIKRPGALRKTMGIKKGETLPKKKLSALVSHLKKKKERKGSLSAADTRTQQQANLAKTLKGMQTA